MSRAWSTLASRFAFTGERRTWSKPWSTFGARLDGRSADECRAMMRAFGPGTAGDFLHFPPPAYCNTHAERIGGLLDPDELDELLADWGPLLVLATSDNGDACGVLPAESTARRRSRVYRLPPRSFEAVPLADGLHELLSRLADGEDLFGVGPLEPTFACAAPYGRLATEDR